MTLVLSLVVAEVVVQVSDRRISLLAADGTLTPRDDMTNKALLYCNRVVFGFTGLAELRGQRTDLWLAERLAATDDLGEAFARIRDDLTELFRHRLYRPHRHTVVAAGYKLEQDQSLTPYYAIISNCYQDGRWLAQAQPTFLWLWEACPPGTFGIFQAPAWVETQSFSRLRRNLRAVGDRSLDVTNAIRLMVEAVRDVAASQVGVGADLMLSVLPCAAAAPRDDTMILSGPPSPETPTFLYLPVDASPVQYGPTFTCGGSIMSDFQAGPA